MIPTRWAAVLLVFTMVLASACASTGRKRVEAANSDMARFRSEVGAAQQQIELLDSIMGAVTRLQGAELQEAYAAYGKETKVLMSQAEKVRKRRDAMTASGSEYFAAWEKESQALSNPSLQQAATERRQKLLAGYSRLTKAMDDTGRAYRPYESSLTDIRTYLDNDLTPSGVRAITSEMNEAKQQGRSVHALLAQVQQATAEIQQALSSQGG